MKKKETESKKELLEKGSVVFNRMRQYAVDNGYPSPTLNEVNDIIKRVSR